MKNYTRPNIEITTFEVTDIITESGAIININNFTGEDITMYQMYEKNSGVGNINASVFTW